MRVIDVKPQTNKDLKMNSRRQFFKTAGIAGGAIAVSAVSKVAMAALPEPVLQTKPDTMPPLVPRGLLVFSAISDGTKS